MSRGYSRHITHGELRIHAQDPGVYGVYGSGPPGVKLGTIERAPRETGWVNRPTGMVSQGPYPRLKDAIARFESDATEDK